jgi:hypothetical protein
MNTELMRIFSFTDTDLKHNQSGMLSPEQKQRIASHWRVTAAVMLAFAAAALIGIFFFARQLIDKPLPLSESGIYWMGSLALAIMAGFLFLQVIRPPDQSMAQQRGPVQLVQHQSTESDSSRAKITHEMWVGSERFIIDKATFDSLTDGQEMIIYYTRDTLRILSAEVKAFDAVPVS